jgi:hypothetical protein
VTTTTVKEQVQGHYEVLERPYEKVYKWVPVHALIPQRNATEGTTAACPRCDADYKGVVKRLGEKPLKEDDAYTSAQREYQE